MEETFNQPTEMDSVISSSITTNGEEANNPTIKIREAGRNVTISFENEAGAEIFNI